MQPYIASADELQNLIQSAVEEVMEDKVAEIVRKATRKEWLSTKEAMEFLNCSRRHLFYLRESGKIAYSKHGRKVLFHIEELERFLKENEVKNNRK